MTRELTDADIEKIIREYRRQSDEEQRRIAATRSSFEGFLSRIGLYELVKSAGKVLKWIWDHVFN